MGICLEQFERPGVLANCARAEPQEARGTPVVLLSVDELPRHSCRMTNFRAGEADLSPLDLRRWRLLQSARRSKIDIRCRCAVWAGSRRRLRRAGKLFQFRGRIATLIPQLRADGWIRSALDLTRKLS